MASSKIWNGASHVTGILKVWSGSAWITKPYFYNGSTWVPLFPSGNVQVTGTVSSSHFQSGNLTHAGVQFMDDGGLDKIGPNIGDRTAHNAGEWWSEEPAAGIGSSYDVRCASITSGSWNFQAAAVGTWVNISTNPIWRVTVTAMASPALSDVEAEFEIQPAGGGAVLATFTVIASASN